MALDLDQLEALAQDATAGPWVDYDDFIVSEGLEGRACADRKTIICQFFDKSERDFYNHPANVKFIAAIRNALPDLIARARRADELEANQ